MSGEAESFTGEAALLGSRVVARGKVVLTGSFSDVRCSYGSYLKLNLPRCSRFWRYLHTHIGNESTTKSDLILYSLVVDLLDSGKCGWLRPESEREFTKACLALS